MRKTDKTGEKFLTNEGYEIIIVEYNSYHDLWIKFQDEYKARIHTSYNACQNGSVKNPYHPSVYGHGCLGLMSDGCKPITSINNKHTREYYLWKAMIQRCYDEKYHERQPSYKDASVCERWLVFANFLDDLPKIKNYKLWKNNEDYVLDKDMYGNDSKIYSLDTCCFITNTNNSKERLNRLGNTQIEAIKIKVYGINVKTGERTRDFNSISEASKELNICDSNICACLKGRYKQSGGYRWYKIDDEN